MAPLFEGLLQIILVGKDSKLLPVLSEDQVRKIPRATFDEFMEACEKQVHGHSTVAYIKDERHHLSIQRIVQWITKGEEALFLVEPRMQVCNKEGDRKCIPFARDTHANEVGLSTSTGTRTHFAEDASYYAFSISARFNDLRNLLSEKIRSYPVYSHEIAVLLEKLYPEEAGVVAGIDDRLHHFIGMIMHSHDVLKHEPKLLPALSKCVAPAVQLDRLLPHINISAISNALTTMRAGVDNVLVNSVLLKSFEDTCLTTSASTANTRNTLIVPTEAPPNNTAINKAITDTLFDGKSIVVPKSSGSSRLLATADGAAFDRPNQTFRYHQSEHLLILFRYASGWLKVRNKRREVGDIAELLVVSSEAALGKS